MTNVHDTYYLLGSALGPHPYPLMVRDFQSVIGREAREQILSATGKLPRALVACVGGGSNAIGLFHPFIGDEGIRLIGVEAGGCGDSLGEHAARFHSGEKKRGWASRRSSGTMSYVLQDTNGQIATTHSISAGLDYSAIGPEHAFLPTAGEQNMRRRAMQKRSKAFDLRETGRHYSCARNSPCHYACDSCRA